MSQSYKAEDVGTNLYSHGHLALAEMKEDLALEATALDKDEEQPQVRTRENENIQGDPGSHTEGGILGVRAVLEAWGV